jgi:hypothetical protein
MILNLRTHKVTKCRSELSCFCLFKSLNYHVFAYSKVGYDIISQVKHITNLYMFEKLNLFLCKLYSIT